MALRFLTAGESHGPALTVIVEGLPRGVPVDRAALDRDLRRRQAGYGRGGRMQIENDRVEITGGVRHGATLGSPVSLVIRNQDHRNWEDVMSPDPQPPEARERRALRFPRPGHADLAGVLKYQTNDLRDVLERASARETTARVAAGGLARALLEVAGVRIRSHVVRIGEIGIESEDVSWERLEQVEESPLRCVEPEVAARMIEAIDRAKRAGDSLGGGFEVVAKDVPPGLGSYSQWDRRLDGRLAQALMSIPAVKAVAIGAGFAADRLPGSAFHDEIVCDAGRGIHRPTNRAGGIEGGLSNGEEVRLRVTVKPIPTLMTPLRSVNLETKQPEPASYERSDVCVVPAAAVVGEAMTALVLADALLEKVGGDSVPELLGHLEQNRSAWRQALGRPREGS